MAERATPVEYDLLPAVRWCIADSDVFVCAPGSLITGLGPWRTTSEAISWASVFTNASAGASDADIAIATRDMVASAKARANGRPITICEFTQRNEAATGVLFGSAGRTILTMRWAVGSPLGARESARAMTFGEALDALKSGKRVCRAGWNSKGMWLLLQRPDAQSKMTLPYLYIEYPVGHPAYPDGCRVPWLASQTDMLADDWQIVP